MPASSRTFEKLYDFIDNKVRMSHVYQPLMLTALLEHAGKANTPDIARALLIEDTPNDVTITGFNIGLNAGESAGQTVFYCHTHLIPRRDGDVENPRGGGRHVIHDKGSY